ncbi:MAG: GyrI-like domain-containing protein [Planctomycetaceae bacterium]|nr:GyrI-like domain-containing protein [Planctomycetaceae bacterium]
MIETPQIVQTVDQPMARIPLTVPRAEIRNVMGPGIGEVMSTVAAQGIAVTGPWFTHHLRRPTDVFDFEICVPVASPVTASGRVQPGTWPAMKVARTVYHGPYEQLGDAWGEFDAWVAANTHKPSAELWECYLAGPESGPDGSKYRTQLNRPLIG